MPDDSNGIYSVPAGTIVSTGDTILPSQHNPWANDSASAISNRFSKDGRAPATGNWNINNFRLTNVGAPVAGGDAVNKTYADALDADKLDILQPSVDVASAAATDIGAAASQNVRITGTVTITSLGTAPAGTFRRVLFSGALTLTHNGTSLILPGAANITTTAGDVAEFVSEGSGNWRCVMYQYSSMSYSIGTTTPTLTPDIGSITTSSCTLNYTKIGRVVHFSATISITTAGTGGQAINMPLPFTASIGSAASGRELTTSGNALSCSIAPASSNCRIVYFNNTSMIVSGASAYVSGSYIV